MVTGWITWTCLLLTAGAPAADDVIHMNQRGFQIPIRIQPERQNEVRELILYMSKDQGRTWEIYNRALPTSKAFDFYAEKDGLLYFSVAITDRRGVQDPPDIYKAPVGQKIHIDTTRPAVRIVSTDRRGDEVQVAWEARDDYPDWTGFKLEWKSADNPGSLWTPLPVQPSERGNHKFRVNTRGDLTVRVVLRDQAGNDAMEEKVVPGSEPMQDRALSRVRSDDLPPPLTGPAGSPPPPAPAPSMPLPMATAPTAPTVISSASPGLPSTVQPTPTMPEASPLPLTSSSNAAPSSTPLPSRGVLPSLQIVNKRQVKLGFDVARFGPSGLGTVDVYMTTDEGATWEKMQGDPGVSLPVSPEVQSQGPVKGTVTVQLPAEGKIHGFFLVVKSRAGLGKPGPRPGDVPHVRLECDTTPPMAELYAPQPDPSRGSSLVLLWKAEDRNLASNPVSLEWSDKPNGPWTFIGEPQLPNTGRYTWQVPANTPPKVYLKLTVRDTAGNAAVAKTDDAILIDLTVPEVGGVQVIGR